MIILKRAKTADSNIYFSGIFFLVCKGFFIFLNAIVLE